MGSDARATGMDCWVIGLLGGAMIAFCHACNMTALLGHIGFLGGAMIAFCHACNMTALLGHRVSGWGDDSIRTRMQHDRIVVS